MNNLASVDTIARIASPAHFAFYASQGKWKPYNHLIYLNRFLMDVEAGKIKRLAIFMPPRHGKTMLAGNYFPAHYLGLNPHHQVMVVGHTADFVADKHSKPVRGLVREHGHLFGVRLSRESSRADYWQLEGHGGGMMVAGAEGSVTGYGANLLIIDDPVKGYRSAMSPSQREHLWSWYTADVHTRLAPDAAIVLIMTRWHEDDLAGRILASAEEMGEEWTVVRLPALAEENDPLGRKPGEALCPAIRTREQLLAARALDPEWFDALYQQSPRHEQGQFFRREDFRFYRQLPDRDDIEVTICSWDLTFKNTDGSDYVVGQVWSKAGSGYFLRDQVRDKMTFVEALDAILAMDERHPDILVHVIEDKANGPAILDVLQGRLGASLEAYDPDRSKGERAHRVKLAARSGRIYLPHPDEAPWIDAYIDEFLKFRVKGGRSVSAHDDQVDATSQAILWFEGAEKIDVDDILFIEL